MITETNWATVPGQLTGIAWAPDGSGRLFVITKGGQVRIVQTSASGPPVVLPTPFAVETVVTTSECGLIGLALDPNFAINGYVYLFATVSTTEQQIIRYTASGDVGTARTVLVSGLPTRGANHDGGAIGIGHDGHLYWAIGDLGNLTGNQTSATALPPLTTLAGKVGRAHRDGSVPADNPFFDGDGPNVDYVWARGFRNPFTLTFHPITGDLWLNVVGSSYEQAFLVPAGANAGYHFYEANQPEAEPYVRARIKYRTGADETYTLSSATRAGGVTTYTVSAQHLLRQGARVTIAGSSDASFDGTYYVASVPAAATPLTFTVAQPGPDATSTGGTATSPTYGRAIGGGVFYDGTLFPASFRGDFFFPDYVSGRVMRARMSGPTTVAALDDFADMQANALDVDVGPDGALYLMRIGGQIVRYGYDRPAQAIVVSQQHVRMDEEGARAVGVRLATAPATDVVVSVARTAGDTDVSVELGATLTFTTANYATPQIVRFRAADDADRTDDAATFEVSSPGIASESVTVSVLDDDAAGLIASTGALVVDEGASDTFTVALGAPRVSPVDVTVAHASGDPDVTVASGAMLAFDVSTWSAPQTVTIAAAHDDDTADDTATVELSAPGFVTRTVVITVRDDDDRPPEIVSAPPSTIAVEGIEHVYDVEATGNPVPTYALGASAPAGTTIDPVTGVLRWTPGAPGTGATMTVIAGNGVLPDATQTYELTVVEDQPPVASLTQPLDGDVVSGTMAELYGDGIDDVGAVRGEFFVDGVLDYTDPGSMGHFHHGGAHLLWDTTRYADGPHRVRFVVYDEKEQSGSMEIDVVVDNEPDVDAGPGIDAGTSASDAGAGDAAGTSGDAAPSDAGVPSGPGGGCACRAGGVAPRSVGASIGLPVLALAIATRRRRRTR